MKKLILKSVRMLKQEDFDKIKSEICRDIKELGFAIVPPNIEVYEFDDPCLLFQVDQTPDDLAFLPRPKYSNGKFYCTKCGFSFGICDGLPHIIYCRKCGAKHHR